MTQTQRWLTESLRFSLLGTAPEGGKIAWSSLTGHEPDSVTNRPAQQLSIEEGTWEGLQLVVTGQPGRIDIALSAVPKDFTGLPNLGEFAEISLKFERLLGNVTLPAVSRLAMGATINTFPGSVENSNLQFRKLVPELSLADEVSDVMIQLNRAKKFPKLSGFVMNRLTKWAQLITQTIQIQNHEQQVAPKQSHLIQLELDFNTHPASKLPHPSSYVGIVAALFDEARLTVAGAENG
jgi:hypothetical protein